MGYNNKENISEVSRNSENLGDGFDTWTFDASLGDLTVEGDFDLDINRDRVGGSEASDGYTFSALNTSAYGSLSYNTTTGKFTFTIDKAAVIASGSDQVVSFTVTGYGGNKSDDDIVRINIAICVQRGTLIKTAQGEVAVEALELGDRVLTLDSGYQPIRWIGSRKLGRSDLNHAPELRPIRIGKGALGPDSPAHDLIVSPQHRVLLSGWKAELYFGAPEILVPAKSLVNDRDIRIARDIDDVEYFHVLFDRHEIMLTNGAPTESFFPGDYVLEELNTAVLDELTAIFPDLLANPVRFGPSARPSVRPSEAAVLRSRLLH